MILHRQPTPDEFLDAVAHLVAYGRLRFWAAGYELCAEMVDARVACLDGMVRSSDPAVAMRLSWRIGVITSALGYVEIAHVEHPLFGDASWIAPGSCFICRGCLRDWITQVRPDPRDPSVRVIIDVAACGPPEWRFDSSDLLSRVDLV